MTIETSIHSGGARFTVEPHHPSLPGHFPGHPIVPGVVALNAIVEYLSAIAAPGKLAGIIKLKFLRPLDPGASVEISHSETKAGNLRFVVKLLDTSDVCIEGHIRVQPSGT